VLKSLHSGASNRFATIILKSNFIDLGGIKRKKMGYVGRRFQMLQISAASGIPGSDWLKKDESHQISKTWNRQCRL